MAPDPQRPVPCRACGPLSWACEPHPAAPGAEVQGATLGGALGWGLAVLGGASGPARLLCAAAGAVLGGFAARHRVHVSWDPALLEPRSPEEAA